MMVRRLVPEHFHKAPHGSYDQMGAELGFTGLVLFFCMIWCALRTLVMAKTLGPEEERVRRVLFVLVISYLVSSWMVDFGYRPTLFMFLAATAAFHRILYGIYSKQGQAEEEEEEKTPVPAWRRALRRSGGAAAGLPGTVGTLAPAAGPLAIAAESGEPGKTIVVAPAGRETVSPAVVPTVSGGPTPTPVRLKPVGVTTLDLENEKPVQGGIFWNRFGIFEIAGPLFLCYLTLRFWAYILKIM